MGPFFSTIFVGTLLLCSIPIILLYVKCKLTYRYWKNKKIPYLEPTFPFGNFRKLLTFQQSFNDFNDDIYKKCKNKMKQSFIGVYSVARPMLFVTDPYLLKYILIKDFDAFTDRGMSEVNEKNEPIQGHLFNKEGHEWKKLRNKMSPTFTSGKIKYMYPLIEGCSQHLIKKIKSDMEIGGASNMEVDIKDYCARYTTDVIGSTAFGVEINSLENPDSDFRKVSAMLLKPSIINMMKFAILALSPLVKRFVPIRIMNEELTNFFTNMVTSNISYREKNNIKRDDFLNIMMELKDHQKGKEISTDDLEITENVIIAQAFVFFFAGFETSSSALSFSLYELARNKDIQSKLRSEIKKTLAEFGSLTYEALQKMSYLDKVCKETLRMYPALPQLNRKTVRKYQIPGTDIVLDENTKIVVPSMSIHRDPEYYPNPNEFNPENFSQENIDSRPHLTYLPFGDGPRNCIGLRFGLVQFKCGLAQLISNFEFEIDPAAEKMTYLKGSLLLQTTEPLKLKLTSVR